MIEQSDEKVKDSIKHYWNWRSETYHKEFFSNINEEIKVFSEIFSKIIPPRNKLKVLEIGTGPGIIAMSIASLGHDVTALDLSDEMLKKARCNAERLGYDIKFMQGDAENLLFDDSEFDFVVSKYVMWTLPNPDKFVKEACRVLSNGGIFCAIDNIWHNRTESLVIPEGLAYYYECYKDLKEELPLFYENSADKIIEITKRHGMSNEKIQYLNTYDMFLKNYDNQTHASEYLNPPYMVTAEKLC